MDRDKIEILWVEFFRRQGPVHDSIQELVKTVQQAAFVAGLQVGYAEGQASSTKKELKEPIYLD